MVGALGPTVRGAGRLARRTAAFHTAGLVLGATAIALVLGLLGVALRAVGLGLAVWVLIGGTLVLAVLQILGLRPLQSRWQVPEPWRRLMDIDVLAGFYGFLLGLGVFTAVVVSGFWVFVAMTLAVPPAVGLAGWLAYALVRAAGLVVVVRTTGERELVPSPARIRLLVLATLIVSVLAVVAQPLKPL